MIPSDLCFARAVAPENQLCCDFVFASGHELDLLFHGFEFFIHLASEDSDSF